MALDGPRTRSELPPYRYQERLLTRITAFVQRTLWIFDNSRGDCIPWDCLVRLLGLIFSNFGARSIVSRRRWKKYVQQTRLLSVLWSEEKSLSSTRKDHNFFLCEWFSCVCSAILAWYGCWLVVQCTDRSTRYISPRLHFCTSYSLSCGVFASAWELNASRLIWHSFASTSLAELFVEATREYLTLRRFHPTLEL